MTSINHCAQAGSLAWSATIRERGYRLNVGQVEVLTCYYYPSAEPDVFKTEATNGLICLRVMVSGITEAELLEKVAPAFEVEEMSYQSVGKEHWCVRVLFPLGRLASDADRVAAIRMLSVIQAAHALFVVDAAHTSSGRLRKSSNFARFNSPPLTELARQTLAPKFTYELAMAGFLENDELLASDIPGENALWDSTGPFALTFAGDSTSVRAKRMQDIYQQRSTESLTTLRQALYDFQRAWRWSDCSNISDQELSAVQYVLAQIRDRVQRGLLD